MMLSHLIKVSPCIKAAIVVAAKVETTANKMVDDVRRAQIFIVTIEDDALCRPLDEVKQDRAGWRVPLEDFVHGD